MLSCPSPTPSSIQAQAWDPLGTSSLGSQNRCLAQALNRKGLRGRNGLNLGTPPLRGGRMSPLLTSFSWNWLSAHTAPRCQQERPRSGRVSTICSMVTTPLAVGGGARMVGGALGIQEHQSYCRGSRRHGWAPRQPAATPRPHSRPSSTCPTEGATTQTLSTLLPITKTSPRRLERGAALSGPISSSQGKVTLAMSRPALAHLAKVDCCMLG